MKYVKSQYPESSLSLSYFEGDSPEVHAIITPRDLEAVFPEQLRSVVKTFESCRLRCEAGLRPVFMRWFLSDAANQAHMLPADIDCARSVIQQPPLDGSRLALWVLFKTVTAYEEIAPGVWGDRRGELWMGDVHSGSVSDAASESPDAASESPEVLSAGDSFAMTAGYLEYLDSLLQSCAGPGEGCGVQPCGGSLARNCVRTWFMVRDIDVNYPGVVEGRNKVFAEKGLTSDTHFIASTGINGSSADPRKTVAFNAYADLSLRAGQIRHLYASTHMNRTSDYGVAFERGTVMEAAGKRTVFISGTASIDSRGEIMYPGDIRRQTDRMLENIGALLGEADASWHDVAHFIVYLRDMADYPVVAGVFAERLPDVPTVIVQAAVCRPGWLVEAECMAII